MEVEIWKDIVGYEGIYQVSNLGSVKSLSRKRGYGRGRFGICKERIMRQNPDDAGYPLVGLFKNGKQKTFKVHALVANMFLKKIHSKLKLVVNHIDGVPSNNNVLNLEFVTNRENVSHAIQKRKSKCIGVTYLCKSKNWKAHAWVNGTNKHIGHYETEEMASIAYNDYLKNIGTTNKYSRANDGVTNHLH